MLGVTEALPTLLGAALVRERLPEQRPVWREPRRGRPFLSPTSTRACAAPAHRAPRPGRGAVSEDDVGDGRGRPSRPVASRRAPRAPLPPLRSRRDDTATNHLRTLVPSNPIHLSQPVVSPFRSDALRTHRTWPARAAAGDPYPRETPPSPARTGEVAV
eukprot:scaffold1542_cov402-Prasinococcus_capsulatus_cf.AAC.2